MNKISVIIPNFNGQKFLARCFDSIKNQTYKDFDIILVDNDSDDNSIEFTKTNYPSIKIIKLTENTGFAKAVNVGIEASHSELIVLLNNDTEVDQDWLMGLNNAAEKFPDVGSFASKMLDFYDHDIIDSCGISMTWTGRSFNNGLGEKNSKKYEKGAYVFGACGGAAAYRRKLFDSIGLFDEDFFMYLEDVDLSFRAQLFGYKCLYVPESKVYHIGRASSGGNKSPLSYKLCARNRWYMIYKNYPSQKIWSNLFKVVYSEIRYFFAAFKHHFVKEYFWALKSGLNNFIKIAKKRKTIQESTAVSIEYLNKIIEQDFNYKPLIKALRDI